MISPLLNEVVAGQAPELMTFSVEQYHRLTETGVLLEGSPVELIDGVIVRKDRRDQEGSLMNHGPNHAYVMSQLLQLLIPQIAADKFHVRCQLPVTLNDNTEPEPDLAIIQGTNENFIDHHPGPADLVAVMEVAYSSARFDRTTKQRIYASANIPVYWIVNLTDNRLEALSDPDPASGVYQSETVFHAGDVAELPLNTEAAVSVPLSNLLPPL